MSQFDYDRKPELPPLAWCLQTADCTGPVKVTHGEHVVTRARAFFEGAWAADFAGDDFDHAFAAGTGAKLVADGVMLVAPSHSLDRLNVLRNGRRVYVSNSLPFLLAQAGQDLDPEFLFYDSFAASIKYGLKRFEPRIPTRSGLTVHFLYCCNALLERGGALRVLPKAPSPRFSTYGEYRDYLGATIRSTVRNAADARRDQGYSPIATVSRGYDSPAATVLARDAGCREAVTFRDSCGTLRDEDNGSVIAERLDLGVREFGRLDYRRYPDFPEIATSGGPSEFLSFGDALRGRLVFTGFHGDKLWDKNCDKVTRVLVRGDASGHSLTEYRLRAAFVHLPVPFIAADSHPELYAIANSAEMAAWSVGTLYDRPVARRIVEEAGVPRELFGQRKRAAGVVVSHEGLSGTLSERSLADFNGYAEAHWTRAKALKCGALRLVKKFAYLNEGGGKVVRKLGHAAGVRLPRVPDVVPHRLAMLAYGYLGKESLLFHWGTEKLVASYKGAIAPEAIAALMQRPTEQRVAASA